VLEGLLTTFMLDVRSADWIPVALRLTKNEPAKDRGAKAKIGVRSANMRRDSKLQYHYLMFIYVEDAPARSRLYFANSSGCALPADSRCAVAFRRAPSLSHPHRRRSDGLTAILQPEWFLRSLRASSASQHLSQALHRPA